MDYNVRGIYVTILGNNRGTKTSRYWFAKWRMEILAMKSLGRRVNSDTIQIYYYMLSHKGRYSMMAADMKVAFAKEYLGMYMTMTRRLYAK